MFLEGMKKKKNGTFFSRFSKIRQKSSVPKLGKEYNLAGKSFVFLL